jgi:hypothetical protein
MNKFTPIGKIPPFAIADKSRSTINWDGAPLLYRANGKLGTFSAGTRDAGTAIYMHLLDWSWKEEARFGGDFEWWLDVLFINIDRQVSLLPLRSNAATRFGGWLKGLQDDPIKDYITNSVWLRLEMLPEQVEVNETEQLIYLPEIIDYGWVAADDYDASSRWLEQFNPDGNPNCWIIPGEILHPA